MAASRNDQFDFLIDIVPREDVRVVQPTRSHSQQPRVQYAGGQQVQMNENVLRMLQGGTATAVPVGLNGVSPFTQQVSVVFWCFLVCVHGLCCLNFVCLRSAVVVLKVIFPADADVIAPPCVFFFLLGGFCSVEVSLWTAGQTVNLRRFQNGQILQVVNASQFQTLGGAPIQIVSY